MYNNILNVFIVTNEVKYQLKENNSLYHHKIIICTSFIFDNSTYFIGEKYLIES